MQKRGPAVKQAIIEAASRAFREVGYSSASVDSIAKRAGVSKATLYAHFSNKEGLFRASVQGFVVPILELLPEIKPATNLRSELIGFATRLSGLLMAPEKVEWDRMMVSTSKKFPNLARDYFAAGPQRAMRQLAEFLECQDQAGFVRVDDPKFSAEMLCGMLFGTKVLRNLIFAQDFVTDQKQVQRTVDAFLKVHAL